MSADGWQARFLSWVLAIIATLAIVGAVATMSTNTMPGGSARSDGPYPTTQRADDSPVAIASNAPFTTGAPRAPQPPTPAMRQADALRDIAGWLKALTFAVVALVAVAAVGVLALFRLGRR